MVESANGDPLPKLGGFKANLSITVDGNTKTAACPVFVLKTLSVPFISGLKMMQELV